MTNPEQPPIDPRPQGNPDVDPDVDPGSDPGIAMPAPTAAPMFLALGLSLLLAGLVTNELVSIVGLVAAVWGAIHWWREVLPSEHHEHVALQPEHERAQPVVARVGAVEHLQAGVEGHRVRVPAEMHPYTSGLKGGLAGAAAMAGIAMLYGLIAEASPWYPINLLSSVVLPAFNLADAAQLNAFSASALVTATLMHLGLSLLVGLVYAALLPMLPGRVLLWGGVVAPCLWSAVTWTSLGVVSPALAEHIQWAWFVASQIAFGLVAGAVIARSETIETLQTWPLAARAGIEGGGLPDLSDATDTGSDDAGNGDDGGRAQ
ncbi:hypothetical protein MK489_05360 [Myxococcota bacterium]|nr:hypothetical protein [Myxococcota bacterium]